MVWPFTSSKDAASKSSTNDPLRDLDPSLRAFLEKESPLRYDPPGPTPSTSKVPPSASTTTTSTDPSSSPALAAPKPSRDQSLFPDGRYEHLWRTYRPQREVEDANKTDQEKLLDVLAAYKDRRESISHAAIENCALQQWAVNDCFRTGPWAKRFGMCRHETKALDRCVAMNARFLKALGYLSNWERPPEVDEEIQMHADKLYTRMLEREEEVERARKDGREVPSYDILMGRDGGTKAAERPKELDMLNDKAKAEFEEKLKKLSPVERYMEEMAYAAELRAASEASWKLEKHREQVKQAKDARQEKGQATLSDKISSIFGW